MQVDRSPEGAEEAPERVAFDVAGLVPCVVQDHASGEVLTLAYMSGESLQLTLDTGEVHFHSRSRDEIWRKGETSGNVLRVRDLRLDCDGDAILALVEPAGPACHTGARSCFHNTVPGAEPPQPVPFEAQAALERVLESRAAERPEGSYTTRLLEDRGLAAAKVAEEAEELGRAVRDESAERVAEEAADLAYHLAVLRSSRGVGRREVDSVLNRRRG